MVWHIFRKDVRLLWPLVAMVGLLQFASAGTRLALGHFGDPPQLALIASLLSGMMFLGIAILIIAAVQQDTVPGVNQDWLVRPISRRDLVLAKLLFLLIAVHGPAPWRAHARIGRCRWPWRRSRRSCSPRA